MMLADGMSAAVRWKTDLGTSIWQLAGIAIAFPMRRQCDAVASFRDEKIAVADGFLFRFSRADPKLIGAADQQQHEHGG